MNSNRRVLHFVTGSISIYLLISIAGTFLNISWMPFKRVNLISDVMRGDSTVIVDNIVDSNVVVIEDKPDKDFELYHQPKYITSFATDLSKPSLTRFLEKLRDLKSGKKRRYVLLISATA
jgi:hypothetical protein